MNRFRPLLAKAALAAAALVPMLTALPAGAAVVHYQEAVDGDLPEYSPLPTLTFGVGANTVAGSQFFDARNGVAADFDQFRFVLPAHTQLVGISLETTITRTVGQLSLPLYLDIYVDAMPSVTVAAHEKVNLLDPSNPLAGSFAATLPIDAGNYLFFEGQVGSLYNGQAAFWNYTWTFDVAAVPEPASAGLAAIGLLAVGATRRRGRRA